MLLMTCGIAEEKPYLQIVTLMKHIWLNQISFQNYQFSFHQSKRQLQKQTYLEAHSLKQH